MRVEELSLLEHGIEIKSDLITRSLIDSVISELNTSDTTMPKYGIRNAEKKISSILSVAQSKSIISEATKILGSSPQLVRSIFFDKTPENNWLVSWHQDKTIALSNKFERDGWGPWTIKDGVHHVQPPVDVLNQMITFRIHLDPANTVNGCLKVIPSSHTQGILKQKEINSFPDKNNTVMCIAARGDTVIMRPHILHSSSKASVATHRRIIHLEYSNYQLPSDITWV